MSFNSINTNTSAAVALQSLSRTNDLLETTQKRISTGFRVADARDDGGAFAVAQRVRGDIAGLTSANEQLSGVKGLVETLPWFELFMLACQALRDVRISSVARFLRFDA